MGTWPQRCRPGGHRATVGLMNSPGAGDEVGLAIDAGPGRGPVDEARMHQLADEQAALRRPRPRAGTRAHPPPAVTPAADPPAPLPAAPAPCLSPLPGSPAPRPRAPP